MLLKPLELQLLETVQRLLLAGACNISAFGTVLCHQLRKGATAESLHHISSQGKRRAANRNITTLLCASIILNNSHCLCGLIMAKSPGFGFQADRPPAKIGTASTSSSESLTCSKKHETSQPPPHHACACHHLIHT